MVTNNDAHNMDGEFLIDHVALSVSNMQRSIDFYVSNFGFTCARVTDMANRNGKVALLKKRGFTIEMFALANAGEFSVPSPCI